MTSFFQLKISLRDSRPLIWRRIIVKDNITFHKLHEILQVVMGWANYHLYDFVINEQRFTLLDHDWNDKMIDSRKIKVHMLKLKQKFQYTYDFGDCWEHQIILEKILPSEEVFMNPFCIAGALSYPPEDCGSIFGYYRLLAIQKNKKHPEYKELIKGWLGEKFDPKYFNLHQVNKQLMEQFADGRARYWVPKK